MTRSLAIALVVLVGIAALWWSLLREQPPRPEPDVALPRESTTAVTEPPAIGATRPASRIVPRPSVEVAELAQSRGESRAAVAPGKARLEIPVIEADGTPATARRFDVVTSMGAKDAEEIAKEERWVGVTLSGGTTSLTPRVRPTVMQLGLGADGVVACEVEAHEQGFVGIREAPTGWKPFHPHEKIAWLAVFHFEALTIGEVKRFDPIRLPSIPLLVGGRVEDESGQPVVGAAVRVALTGKAAEDRALSTKTDGLGGRSGTGGAFRVESDVAATGFVAWAHVDDKLASPVVSFAPRQTDLVLRVQTTGALKGRIRVAPKLGDDTPGLVLEPESIVLTSSAFRGRWSPRPYIGVKKDGSFLREGIPAGRYALVITVGITRVMTVEGILIEPGVVTEDPRISDLVVGDDLALAVVKVVDGEGRPVPGATVYWQPADSDGPVRGGNTSRTNGAGESTLPLPEGVPMKVKVEARGFRPWSGERVTLPLLVKLDVGARVTISLPGSRDWAMPDGVMEYLVCLVPESDVDAAAKEKRNPVPARLHRSQCQVVRRNTEDYAFEGVDPGRVVVFIVPRKAPQPGKTITSGEFTMLYDDHGLEIGRLELERGATAPAFVQRVDVDKLVGVALR